MNQSYPKTQKNETAESRLFEDFRKGKTEAFTGLYDLYAQLLFNYGMKLTTDRELLKDCIQEVFVKIYNKRNELDEVLNLKSYLLISLKNKLCDESRKRIHLSDVSLDNIDIISTDNVEKNYLAHEKEQYENALLSRLMNKLSPRQRQAVELYYFEERKYEEICSILKMNYQSVRNLIYRSMLKLRSCACY
jgi:RNA polymerase sigma factor (sigma-70 family)